MKKVEDRENEFQVGANPAAATLWCAHAHPPAMARLAPATGIQSPNFIQTINMSIRFKSGRFKFGQFHVIAQMRIHQPTRHR
jgi:hypothetical protein